MTEGYAVVIHIFDAIFSIARFPSGTVSDVQDADLRMLVLQGSKFWRGLDLSITPKVHTIEDHFSCDQICFFTELEIMVMTLWSSPTKMGLRMRGSLKNLLNHRIAAEWLSKWE